MARALIETSRGSTRRGSPEAIQKRRVARRFNDLLSGRGALSRLDGRTEKRRKRLLKELSEGMARGARELTPVDILSRVSELLGLGESVASIRRHVRIRKTSVPPQELAKIVGELHRAYRFHPDAYRFVGVSDEVVRAAGVRSPDTKSRPKRSAA